MPSLRARMMKPIVRIMGRQLSTGETAEAIRSEYNHWTKTLLRPGGVHSETIKIAGQDCLRSIPKGARKDCILLYFHGGGYVFGSLTGHRSLAERFAKAAGVAAYMPDYRQAPEHPYPAALEDARAIYEELLTSYDASQIALGGDSAGGGLSLALMHQLRDEGRPMPTSAFLLSPWTDLTLQGKSYTTNAATELVVPHPLPEATAAFYAGDTPRGHPGVSPLFASQAGLPPLLVQISTNEILLDDAKGIVNQARAAGVTVQYEPYDDMWHDWHMMAPIVPEANQAIRSIGQFVQKYLP